MANLFHMAGVRFLDAVLPPRCPVTGEVVAFPGALSPTVWGTLDFITAPFCQSCGLPFDIETGAETKCGACLQNPPVFHQARFALRYNDASRDLILSFKHGDKTHLVRGFVPWLQRAGDSLIKDIDMIAPVPLHRWRLLRRRYNQAAHLAQALGRAVDKTVVPDLLRRTRATPSQGHLKQHQRAQNVKSAFALSPRHHTRVQGQKIILIDDVYTTGATVKECTKALLKAGAAQVDVLCLARVVKD